MLTPDGRTYGHTHERTNGNRLSAHPLMMLNICTKVYESTSKGFRVTNLNSMVNARVVDNVVAGQPDIQTHARTDEKPDPYIDQCLRHAQQNEFALREQILFFKN